MTFLSGNIAEIKIIIKGNIVCCRRTGVHVYVRVKDRVARKVEFTLLLKKYKGVDTIWPHESGKIRQKQIISVVLASESLCATQTFAAHEDLSETTPIKTRLLLATLDVIVFSVESFTSFHNSSNRSPIPMIQEHWVGEPASSPPLFLC